MELKDRLRQLRGSSSQVECAKKLGVSAANYNKWENGVAPNYKILCKIADFYGISLDYLVGRTDMKSIEYSNAVEASGLSEAALIALQELREHAPEEFEMLNYMLERDIELSQVDEEFDELQYMAMRSPISEMGFKDFPLIRLLGLRTVLKYMLYSPESFIPYYRDSVEVILPDTPQDLAKQIMQSKMAEYYLERALNFEKYNYWISTGGFERRKRHEEKS